MASMSWTLDQGWSLYYLEALVEFFYLRGRTVLVAVMDSARVACGHHQLLLDDLAIFFADTDARRVHFVIVVSMVNDLHALSSAGFAIGYDHVGDVGRCLALLASSIRSRWPSALAGLVYCGISSDFTDGWLYEQAVSRIMSMGFPGYDVALDARGHHFSGPVSVGYLSHVDALRLLIRVAEAYPGARL